MKLARVARAVVIGVLIGLVLGSVGLVAAPEAQARVLPTRIVVETAEEFRVVETETINMSVDALGLERLTGLELDTDDRPGKEVRISAGFMMPLDLLLGPVGNLIRLDPRQNRAVQIGGGQFPLRLHVVIESLANGTAPGWFPPTINFYYDLPEDPAVPGDERYVTATLRPRNPLAPNLPRRLDVYVNLTLDGKRVLATMDSQPATDLRVEVALRPGELANRPTSRFGDDIYNAAPDDATMHVRSVAWPLPSGFSVGYIGGDSNTHNVVVDSPVATTLEAIVDRRPEGRLDRSEVALAVPPSTAAKPSILLNLVSPPDQIPSVTTDLSGPMPYFAGKLNRFDGPTVAESSTSNSLQIYAGDVQASRVAVLRNATGDGVDITTVGAPGAAGRIGRAEIGIRPEQDLSESARGPVLIDGYSGLPSSPPTSLATLGRAMGENLPANNDEAYAYFRSWRRMPSEPYELKFFAARLFDVSEATYRHDAAADTTIVSGTHRGGTLRMDALLDQAKGSATLGVFRGYELPTHINELAITPRNQNGAFELRYNASGPVGRLTGRITGDPIVPGTPLRVIDFEVKGIPTNLRLLGGAPRAGALGLEFSAEGGSVTQINAIASSRTDAHAPQDDSPRHWITVRRMVEAFEATAHIRGLRNVNFNLAKSCVPEVEETARCKAVVQDGRLAMDELPLDLELITQEPGSDAVAMTAHIDRMPRDIRPRLVLTTMRAPDGKETFRGLDLRYTPSTPAAPDAGRTTLTVNSVQGIMTATLNKLPASGQLCLSLDNSCVLREHDANKFSARAEFSSPVAITLLMCDPYRTCDNAHWGSDGYVHLAMELTRVAIGYSHDANVPPPLGGSGPWGKNNRMFVNTYGTPVAGVFELDLPGRGSPHLFFSLPYTNGGSEGPRFSTSAPIEIVQFHSLPAYFHTYRLGPAPTCPRGMIAGADVIVLQYPRWEPIETAICRP